MTATIRKPREKTPEAKSAKTLDDARSDVNLKTRGTALKNAGETLQRIAWTTMTREPDATVKTAEELEATVSAEELEAEKTGLHDETEMRLMTAVLIEMTTVTDPTTAETLARDANEKPPRWTDGIEKTIEARDTVRREVLDEKNVRRAGSLES